MTNSKGVNLVKVRVEELIISTYEKMSESFEHTLDHTLQ